MSTVHLHIGQCGNQLSVPLWQNFIKSSSKGTEQVFTSLDGWHRSVHIDSERKVIALLPETFRVREKNVVFGKRGRGTNFALGYSGVASLGDDHVLESALEAVRKEIERCDIYSGVIVYHSISGGTGSGLGAHMIEMLRDNYPCNYILSCAVAPCVSGESPLQNYNALLALHWLQNYSDCIILLPNDFYLSRLHCKLHSDEAVKQLSFKDLNSVIASNLCGVFLPTTTLSLSKNVSIGQEPWELVRTLTPMPSTKFVHLSQHISSRLSWEEMTSKVLSTYPKYNSEGVQNHCLSGTVVARGDKDNIFLAAVNRGIDKKVKKGVNVVSWNPYPFDWWRTSVNTVGSKKNCSITLATNSTCILDHLNTIQAKSQVKLESGAYLHWYDRYGISQTYICIDQSIKMMHTPGH
ncbi:unnamed protein product [Candidula unifasciata]|uniref:Tubulin/FtsZ GTPase domain-containing protein n=1 Tax=Candidula unifasciata TaxID=100452 RepID=A0A8S3YJ56_9EUPU|nr:unnamed protein product [Candidula unifasciata]